ncbi:MAG: hypothetical protein ABI303_01845 [Candidatus Saccharimonas sp.]
MKRLFALLAFPIIIGLSILGSHQAYAASFDPGRIIDDGVMENASAMSAEQIQTFLNSKVPTCDTNGTMPASDFGRSDLTHAQYAAARGWSAPPYTCLKDYTENGVTVAQLLYNLSQQYQINPQVLIVTLQKEASLVTDYWPLPSQYKTATGYGCPDSGPNNSANCNSAYYGFTNQITWTAKMYRAILNQSPTWYSPYVVGNNYIQWSPNAGCGGSTVNIQNWSTAALYDYTPYQPNPSALNAGYGMGDGCGAYGNRNFWLYFNDWFGPTQSPNYSWSFAGQYAYTDSSKNTPANLSTLMPGQRIFIGFSARNTGNMTWTNTGNNPIRAGTVRDYNRSSPFYDPSWVGLGRPANLKEASVAPGEVGTFEFWIKAPQVSTGTNFSEYFAPLAEGITWMQDYGMNFGLRVSPPVYTWNIVGQAAYTDDSKTSSTGLSSMAPGERKYISLVIKNTGNVPWTNTGVNPINIGLTRPTDRTSPFYDATWLSTSRPARMKEASVAPGQNATFEFWIKAPITTQGGNYLESFTPLAEGLTWMPDLGLNYSISVNPAVYTWSLVGQAAYVDNTKSAATGLDSMEPTQRKFVSLVIKNTGNVIWTNTGSNPVDLGTTRATDRLSVFFDDSWIGQSRPARMSEASVAPGQNATFEFWMNAPLTWQDSNYLEYFTPVAEGIAWMPDIGLNYRIRVVKAVYSWSLASQYAYTDATKTVPIGLGGLSPNEAVYVGFTAKNTGTVTWTNSGTYPVRVGTSNTNDHSGTFCEQRWLSCTRPALMKEVSVAPGQVGTFEFWIKAPATAGNYREYYNLLSERRAWMTNINFNYNLSVQ